MIKKFITKNIAYMVVLAVLVLWQAVCTAGLVPSYMLPSPVNIAKAFVTDAGLLLVNSLYTITEAAIGLLLSVIFGVIIAVIMENNPIINRGLSPIILFTQSVPTIAIAPLLILWFGYNLLPKILLVFITCFFPIAMGVLSGLGQTDKDAVLMLENFGASRNQIYFHLKFPSALPEFFAAVKISAAYAIISAVVSEWLGGNWGLGVYMTRVRKSFALDKMFASIFLISAISILLVKIIALIETKSMPWRGKFEKISF